MFRLSIPVKVLLTSGVSYLCTLIGFVFFVTRVKWDPKALILGWSLEELVFLIPLFAAILGFAIATYCFFERPLKYFSKAVQKASEGDFLVRAPLESVDEMSEVARDFNRMLSRLNELSSKKVQTEHQLTKAQEELKYKKTLEEKTRLIEKTNRTLENVVRDLSVLYEIGQKINQAIDIEELYTLVAKVLGTNLKLENFSLMVWDEKKHVLQVKAAFGFENNDPILEMSFRKGEGVAGAVFQKGEPLYIQNVAEEKQFLQREVLIEGSLFVLPLIYKGDALGVANFGRQRVSGFNSHDIKMLSLLSNQIALAIANAKLYTQTKELSITDELTRVFNRRHFNHVMQLEWKRALRFKRDLSLLMVDVDHFKKYNDTFGHLKGDEALQKLGSLLSENLREVDTIARFGGEEFVVLLPDTQKRGAVSVAEKLRHLAEETLDGITLSVGVSNFPDDVEEMDDLIDHADIALYEAKDSGRNRVLVYPSSKSTGVLTPSQDQPKRIIH